VFNIKKLDDSKFELQLALAGFEEKYLDVTIEDGTLTITGNQEKSETEDEFVHKGIAARKFTRSWSLADTVVVKDATFKNGILTVSLENEIHEAKKPKSIQIKTGF
jgi:molecular chaperone IbpA